MKIAGMERGGLSVGVSGTGFVVVKSKVNDVEKKCDGKAGLGLCIASVQEVKMCITNQIRTRNSLGRMRKKFRVRI